eukprot:947512-Amorphochlora_amoeboformis.AAC.1
MDFSTLWVASDALKIIIMFAQFAVALHWQSYTKEYNARTVQRQRLGLSFGVQMFCAFPYLLGLSFGVQMFCAFPYLRLCAANAAISVAFHVGSHDPFFAGWIPYALLLNLHT